MARGWQGEEAGGGKGRRQRTEVVGISKSERRAQSHTSVAMLIVAFRTLSTPARAS